MNVTLPEFKDENIRKLAFTHRSYLNENKEVQGLTKGSNF